jgi:hypothetical protein
MQFSTLYEERTRLRLTKFLGSMNLTNVSHAEFLFHCEFVCFLNFIFAEGRVLMLILA